MSSAPRTKKQTPGPTEERIVTARGDRREAILELIRSARRKLVLSVFRCDDFRLMDELDAAIQRGVKVEALMTRRAKGWEEKLADLEMFLDSMGTTIHRYADPVVKYHAKYLVADDKLAAISSGNLTRKCFDKTCDFVLVSRATGIVAGLRELFEEDCRAKESHLPKGLSDRLIVSPQRARAQFTALIQQARRSIHIIDRRLTDPGILALLNAKRANGTEVKLLREPTLGDLVSHGRLLIVDEEVAAIGSISLEAQALDFRREVSVILRDPAFVAQLKKLFDGLCSPRKRPPTVTSDK